MKKELDVLYNRSQKISEEAKKLKEYITYLNAYIFSSKKRAVLFKVSAPIDRTQETSKIINTCSKALIPISLNIHKMTEVFLSEANKVASISQKKRRRELLKYANSAISTEDNLVALCKELKDIMQTLSDENIQYTAMKKSADRLKELFGQMLKDCDDIAQFLDFMNGVYRIEWYSTQAKEQLMDYNMFYQSRLQHIETGDILVSFKSLKFMELIKKKKFDSSKTKDSSLYMRLVDRAYQHVAGNISNYIMNFTDSQVTHVALYIRTDPKDPLTGKLFHSYGGTYSFKDFSVDAGELWIILRPKWSSDPKEKADQRMRLIAATRKHRAAKMSAGAFLSIILPELVRSFFGLFTKKHVGMARSFPNSKAKMFCSQFLNEVFKDAGILLTPKSRTSSSVYPSDIAASGNVTFVGVAFDADWIASQDFSLDDFIHEGVRI